MDWSWLNLPEPPFRMFNVTSYTVHLDGPSIFISASGTFRFHTKEFVWKKLGKWTLPFTGRAHYDKNLEIFVGLSKDSGTLGHLCCCDVNSSNNSNTQCPAPTWKVCQEKLFSLNPGEEHVSAALLYMGSKSEFCFVECILVKDVRADQVLEEGGKDVSAVQVLEEGGWRHRPNRYMYRMMNFSLKLKNGD